MELYFGVEKGQRGVLLTQLILYSYRVFLTGVTSIIETNCTIPFISDEFFHLLEFYVHNDAPLTCRIPARPLSPPSSSSSSSSSTNNNNDNEYIPLSTYAHHLPACLHRSLSRLYISTHADLKKTSLRHLRHSPTLAPSYRQ